MKIVNARQDDQEMIFNIRIATMFQRQKKTCKSRIVIPASEMNDRQAASPHPDLPLWGKEPVPLRFSSLPPWGEGQDGGYWIEEETRRKDFFSNLWWL